MPLVTYYSAPPAVWLVIAGLCLSALGFYGIWRIASRGQLTPGEGRWLTALRLAGAFVLVLLGGIFLLVRVVGPHPQIVVAEQVLICNGLKGIVSWTDIADMSHQTRASKSGMKHWAVLMLTAQGIERHRSIARITENTMRCRIDGAENPSDEIYETIRREWAARRQ